MKKILSLIIATIFFIAIASYLNNNVDAFNPISIPVNTDNFPTILFNPEPTTTFSSEEPEASIWSEYQSLSFYKSELLDRYIEYKSSNPEFDHEKVVTYVNIGLDQPFYSNIYLIDEPFSTTVLVNKYNKLPDTFEPELIEIETSMCALGMGRQFLRKDAKEAFEKMHIDAKQLGLNITAFGTYRSIALQHSIWNNKVNSGRTIDDVDTLNSRGGHSEHHTGLAIDVIRNNYTVESSKEYLWYKENAHTYGFIIRYPKGKEHITGYSFEPWHLRYLGIEIASEIYNSTLTYEEYYAMVLEPTN